MSAATPIGQDQARATFDALLSDALDALAKVVDDGEVVEFWTAHQALNRAMGLLLTHRWDAA
jgi:hypothetical protein